jgi:hypothetical protein
MSIDNWMVAWTPARQPWSDHAECYGTAPGAIEVGPWPDATGWSDIARHKFATTGKVMMLFIDFHTVTVRDGIDPQAAHREFLKVDEYRRRISRDIEGAAS